MSRFAKNAFAYSVVFAIGYFVACGSTTNRGTLISPSPTYSRMLNSTVRNSAIFPTNTGSRPVLASIFGFGLPAHPFATSASASGLGQSFEVLCTVWGQNNAPGIHAAFGNSGLVPMLPPKNGVSVGIWNECIAPIASVGADENGNPTGYPIFDAGTVNSLVAYGVLASGNRFRCLDTSDTSPVQDNTFVRPYYDLARDVVMLGSGTTQLALNCSISIPSGDDVAEIQVQWLKS